MHDRPSPPARPFRLPVAPGAAVTVTVPDRSALMAAIGARLDAGRGFAVATLNLDHAVKLRASRAFRAAYAAQDIVVADGNPIAWLSRLAGRPVAVVPGSELIDPLCRMAADRGLPVALVGSTAEALGTAARTLTQRHPGLRVVARVAPPHGLDPAGAAAEAALGEVAASGARLCFLALGAPRQEILATRGRVIAPACGFVSIGAGLDFIAGHQTRAPRWARQLAMEWAWRMAHDPRRLGPRYLRCAGILPGLALRVLGQRLRVPRHPFGRRAA